MDVGESKVLRNLFYFDGSSFRAGEIRIEKGVISQVSERVDKANKFDDLGGAFVCPAFNDCHCHLPMLAESFACVYLGPEQCPTVSAALRTLSDHARTKAERRWAVGYGYLASAVKEGRYPTLEEFDRALPDRPAYIWQASRHGLLANSAALRAAGINKNTEDPEGGRIGRDEHGNLNGLLFESAIGLLRRAEPLMSREELADNLILAAKHLNSMGITSVTDAASFRLGIEEELWAYRTAADRGMSLRVRLTPLYEIMRRERLILDRTEWDPLAGHPTVSLGGVKLFADGAIGTRTAALSEPYVSGGNGMLLYSPSDLREAVSNIHRSGRQALIHAIGDLAVRAALDAIESAVRERPSKHHRHRIEHAMMLSRDLIRDLARVRVCVAMQPEFLLRFAEDYIQALGERAYTLKPFRSLILAGVPIGFSSDLTIVPGNPADGLLAAVSRRSAKGTHLSATESISSAEALRCYTEGSAYLGFQEARSGRIEPGMHADLVLFERNPLETLSEGGRPSVVGTVFAGRCV